MAAWKTDFDPITIANLVLRLIGFVAGVFLLIFSFTRGGSYSNSTRHSNNWFRVTLIIFLLSVLLGITTIALSRVDIPSVPREDRKSIMNVPFVAMFIETQAFATMTLIQFGLAISYLFGDVGDGAKTGRTTHLCGYLGYFLITVLNIAELAITQQYLEDYIGFQNSSTEQMHMFALSFVIYLFLCIAAFIVLAYTASVRQVPRQAIYILLVVAAVASFARSLYNVVISGIYDLAALNHHLDESPKIPEGIPITATIMVNWFPLVAFLCILFASREAVKSHFYHDI